MHFLPYLQKIVPILVQFIILDQSKYKDKRKKTGFQVFELNQDVYRGIMKLGFRKPTPIQKRAIPVALQGKDLVAMARTGSGKSAAFILPLLQKLKVHSSMLGARGVIISPTRELSQQLFSVCLNLGKFTSIRMCLLQGGDRLEAQFEAIQNFPDVLVCTPGRLSHLLLEMEKDLSLSRVEVLIFDEADRLFEMGFQPQIELILSKCPETRQTMLFSATLPQQLVEFAKAGLKSPELIRLNVDSSLNESLKLAFFKVRSEEKIPGLLYLLTEVIPEEESTIIFVATRHHVEYLFRVLNVYCSLKATVAYGSLDQESREANVDKFRKGEAKILIVTDVAARGLDIPLLNNVVNFDFPANKTVKLFLHRVGRAARQGKEGIAFSFVTIEEVPYLVDVCTFIGIKFDNTKNTSYNLKEMTNKDIDLGLFPQEILDSVTEKFNRIRKEDTEVQSLERSVKNAYELYKRSRESASRFSVRASKKLVVSNSHPLFSRRVVKNDYLFELGNKLRNFKPKETIFEVNDKKIKNNGGKQKQSEAILNLKKKFATVKEINERVIENNKPENKPKVKTNKEEMSGLRDMLIGESKSNKRKAPLSKAERKRLKKGVTMTNIEKAREGKVVEKTPKSEYKEEGYIDTTIETSKDVFKNDAVALQNEVLELTPDEEKAMKNKQKSYKWDKKKKKYIKASVEEHVKSKRVRNEAGKLISLKKRGDIYKKWQKSSKRGFVEGADDTEEGEVNVKKISKSMKEKASLEKQQRGKKGNEIISNEVQLRKKYELKSRNKEQNMKGRKKFVRKERQSKRQSEVKSKFEKSKFPKPGHHKNSRSRIVRRGKK